MFDSVKLGMWERNRWRRKMRMDEFERGGRGAAGEEKCEWMNGAAGDYKLVGEAEKCGWVDE